MTLAELIDLLDEAELNYYGDFTTELRRNEFFARYIIDALLKQLTDGNAEEAAA